MERKRKLIVFSADAMVWEDVEYFKTLPNYKKYLAGGCMIEKVESVYPTITYPCHTTMATGVWPDKHKVPGNYQFKPGMSPLPWRWDYDFVEWKEDIFTAAKKAGYTTAAIFWPVTGNHPYIDYLIDEYWTQGPEDTPRQAWKRMGSSEEMLDIVERHIGENKIRIHPPTERFIISCTCDIIRQYNPDVIFLHPANIDAYRHDTGLFNDKVLVGVEETDQWIGEIMKAVEDAGELENTNLVLTSDHGQMEIKRVINPNVILADHGLIRKNEDGTLKDWDVWCVSGGMSALVYLKDPDNRRIYEKTYKILSDMAEEGIYGISKVFTKEEAGAHHLDGTFSFVLETDDYTSFGDKINRPLVTNYDSADYRYGRATHGYLPHKGPQPIFMAKGPDFREGVVLERGRLIDQAPTYAKILGTELPNADGRVIESFIRKVQE
ncbi:MAG: alkaline phosphatase family protein [Hungatella sp.]|jgi:predicted AlkP superfamily pyrophosphatase or phosphodiesterase|nr:alkaline phosphatase family protein [Hungatella sp.]